MDFISLNGQLLPYDDARIAPADAGLLHGAGLFETMRAKNGKTFRLADHLARLTRSAAAHHISFSLELAQLQEMITELLDANDLAGDSGARLRLTITRGDLHQATADNPEPATTMIISAAAFTPYPAELYSRGMTVIISPHRQNPHSPLTGHKSTSYMDRLLALRQAQLAKAGEALWFTPDNATVAEGSISNLFAVLADSTLATPPLFLPTSPSALSGNWQLETGNSLPLCLPGITRQLVLDLARQQNLPAHERLLTIHDLLSAKELFLTNAIMGIMPVTHIEQHQVATGKPGEMTRLLRQQYDQLLTT